MTSTLRKDAFVVLVTGASRGLGRAIAIHLSKMNKTNADGCTAPIYVAVHYNSGTEAANETLQLLSGEGHTSFQADLKDATHCDRLLKEVIAHYGRIDTLVNNAGILGEFQNVKEMDYDAWQETTQNLVNTNLTSAGNLTFLAIEQFRKQENIPRGAGDDCRGRIVNLSSRGAYRVGPFLPVYCATKGGIQILGQTLARTVGDDKIAFFSASPTVIDSDMTKDVFLKTDADRDAVVSQHPIGRLPTADEVGKSVSWLAAEAPLGISGTGIDVNGASYMHH